LRKAIFLPVPDPHHCHPLPLGHGVKQRGRGLSSPAEDESTSRIDLEHTPAGKKEIAGTRSFGQPVTEQHHLAEAVTELASRAAEKLRKQHCLAVQVLVFIRICPFRKDTQYSRSVVIPLRRPTSDTAAIVKAALLGIQHIFQPGFLDAKAGVMLLDFQPDTQMQTEFDLDDYDASEDRTRLMHAMDTLNQRFGKGSVLTASPDWRGYLGKGP
jgi:DNA polymerase V